MHLFLCIVTLGVWNYIWVYRTTKFLNNANETKKYNPTAELLLCLFVPFYSIYWFYKHSKKVEAFLEQETGIKENIHIIALILSILVPTAALVVLQYHIQKLYDKNQVYYFNIFFEKYKAWIYLSPAIILLLIFTVWPIINTLRMAFWNDYSIMKDLGGYLDFEFGIKNFQKVIGYQGFIDCLKNTLLLCVLTVPLSTILALVIAVCLNAIKPLQRFLQTIFFLPYVTNSIAIGMVFEAMFNIVGYKTAHESVGIINNILGVFGIDPINWINAGSSYWANIAVLVIYIVWNALPFKILVLLGGLQSVSKQYYDAAKIDSTPRLRVFTKITVPLLSPMIAYVVITGFIGGFKEYSSIVGIFGEDMQAVGGESLNTMVGYIYEALGNQEGRASAAALILFAIIFVVTMVNMYVSKKKTHY